MLESVLAKLKHFFTRKYLKYKKVFVATNIFLKEENSSSMYFFLPVYHIGGAERVHLDIVRVFESKKPWMIFSDPSQNDAFLPYFKQCGKIIDVSGISRRRFRKRFVKAVVQKINESKSPVVFGSNNRFFYELVPLLSEHVKCVDLIHAFHHEGEVGAEHWSLPCVPRLDVRVLISCRAKQDLKEQYRAAGLTRYYSKARLIYNCVDVPDEYVAKSFDKRVVMYVGRGSSEKRVWLFGRLAAAALKEGLPFTFVSVGNNYESVSIDDREFVEFYGEVVETEKMIGLYEQAEFVVITSSREGFPMALMEGMARGCIPLATSVGDIPNHIDSNVNGFCVPAEEEQAVESMLEILRSLAKDRRGSSEVSKRSHLYALENYSTQKFITAYQEILSSE